MSEAEGLEIKRVASIGCHVCMKFWDYTFTFDCPKWLILKRLRESGWSIGKRCTCPECNAKKKVKQ